MTKYAINYYLTPEEIADQVITICDIFSPRDGYTMKDYYSGKRLENIARMVYTMHDGLGEIDHHERMQLEDEEQFNAVYKILECENAHTASLAFSIAFGDEWAIENALKTIHHMGQAHAIYNDLQRPEYY